MFLDDQPNVKIKLTNNFEFPFFKKEKDNRIRETQQQKHTPSNMLQLILLSCWCALAWAGQCTVYTDPSLAAMVTACFF